MLTIQSLREEKEQIANALDKRHIDVRKELDQILQWDTCLLYTSDAADE